jgi:TolB protein
MLIVSVGWFQVLDHVQPYTGNIQLQIAFEINLPHNDICIADMESGEPFCLMQTNDVQETHATWSPDGRFIAFNAIQEPVGTDLPSVHIYDLETKSTTELLKAAWVYGWSPDGTALLVARFNEDLSNELYTLQIKDLITHQLTDQQDAGIFPLWSPDGSAITYLSGYPDTKLMLVDAADETVLELAKGMHVNREVPPQWSPDGKVIAFAAYDDPADGKGQSSEIYVVQADGTQLTRLTYTDNINLNPRWSPDGSQLVFYGYMVGAFDTGTPNTGLTEVYIMNADGTGLTNLTQNPGLDYQPAWSPDGSWITFASTRETSGIFVMRPDGSDVRAVITEPLYPKGREANNPVWRPVPSAGHS